MNPTARAPKATIGPGLPSGADAPRLRAAVAADPTAPITVAVQGAGGYGKTTLLAELARVYQEAGVPVVDGAEPSLDVAKLAPAEGTGMPAVLVDDAHRLDHQRLAQLRALAQTAGTKLVVAYRPWPRSAEFDELIAGLGRNGAPVLLGVLDSNAITEYAREVLGNPPASRLSEHIRALTGGVPRLVVRILTALGSGAELTDGEVPRSVLDQFQHDLDRLDDRTRQCLVALALGATPHPDLLATLLDLDAPSAGAAMAAARASGLLDAADALLPVARQAVLALTPWESRLAVLRRLIEHQLRAGGPLLALTRPLLNAPLVPEPIMATAFERAAREALPDSPDLAIALLDAAAATGAPPARTGAPRALAAVLRGDIDGALRMADQILLDESVQDRGLAAQVAASALAHRGLLARSAELCRWSAASLHWSGDAAYAVVGLLATGQLEQAEPLLAALRDSGPPTSMAGSATSLAEGMRESIAGSAATALSTLVNSAALSESAGRALLVPDTPAAAAAIVAMQYGSIEVAESTVDRAMASGTGGPLAHLRHQLLAVWPALLRGDTVTARKKLDEALGAAGEPHARDALMAVALEAGIANRDNDMSALGEVRGRARVAVAHHPVDLFSLLPLGELAVAAARLRDTDWIRPHIAEAWAMLARLGNPPLWSAFLHWRCLHGAIVGERMEAAAEHADTLQRMAEHTPMLGAMATGARVWLDALEGKVNHDQAEQAARGLQAAGLAWDGARLAGQAAIRTTERKTTVALLECARSMQGKTSRPRKNPATPTSTTPASTHHSTEPPPLSDREREVAELVLAGLTYKQVGKRLFISAKTVEHHIGRIRQRLACSTRDELLARLREILGYEQG